MTKPIRQLTGLIAIIIVALVFIGTLFTFDEIITSTTWLLTHLFNFFDFFFTVNIILIAIFIFIENKDPSRTIAWLLVLFLIPWLGFIFYISFGRNTFKKKWSKEKQQSDALRQTKAVEVQKELVHYIDPFQDGTSKNNRLLNLLLNNSGALFSRNNDIEVLTNGDATFSSFIDSLLKAEHHIHMEFFIIKNDDIGNRIKDILIQKAKKGVKVRVIYDAVGSWKLGKTYIEGLKDAGVEIFPFYPVALPLFTRDLNYRNHRKIIVIDGDIGFVGGLNIGDEYLGKSSKLGFWRDTHLKIQGEAVLSLQSIFLNDWAYVSERNIKDNLAYYPKNKNYGSQMAQIVSSGPDAMAFNMLQAYFQMISSADERIWITTPYLVPEDGLMLAFKTAAMSGVDVRIIIPDKPDHFFVYWASRDNIEELLEAGVKIYEYKKGFIHSKIVLVDDVLSTVGTANLDIRSMEINFEVNAFLYDRQSMERLEKDFLIDFEDSREIELEEHKNRKWYYKVLEASGRLVSPLQ